MPILQRLRTPILGSLLNFAFVTPLSLEKITKLVKLLLRSLKFGRDIGTCSVTSDSFQDFLKVPNAG